MELVNRTRCQVVAQRARVCDTWWSRGRGLMFRRPLTEDEAFWFQLDSPGRLAAAIHMFFVFFSIGGVWVDERGRVVDLALARPFHPWYVPRKPASAFVEGPPAILQRCQVGDVLELASCVGARHSE